jgi:hypothetical protein
MLKNVFRSVVAAGTLAVGVSAAHAAVLADFQVSDGSSAVPFTADRIIAGYDEFITLNPDGSFDASLKLTASGFYADDGAVPVNSNLNQTGGYALYALYQAHGTYTLTGFGYDFVVDSGSGNLSIFKDPGRDTTFNQPSVGTTAFGVNAGTADILLATGTPTNGHGLLINLGSSNSGAFGAEESLSLTDAGAAYFVSPNPFYGVALQSGDFTTPTFKSSGTSEITGTLGVTFDVPEPGMVGLLGLGLLAATVSRRNGFKRKQS